MTDNERLQGLEYIDEIPPMTEAEYREEIHRWLQFEKRLYKQRDEANQIISQQAKEIERLQHIVEGGRLPDFAWDDV